MKKIITVCFLFFVSNCFGQQVTFQKTYGGTTNGSVANSVQQTVDGGYIIAGTTSDFGAGSLNVYLIKTDANGDSLWTKNYGGVNGDEGQYVQQTSDGGFIIVGITETFGAGNLDIYLIKTDVNGNLLWSKTFGGPDIDWGNSVQQTTDGGYIITGFTQSFGIGSLDVYLIKTDANGDSLWTKTYGGTNADGGYFAQQTLDGGYIVCGFTEGFGVGASDVYLIKTDANGDVLWTKSFGGINEDNGYSVKQTTSGEYIITGRTRSFGAGDYDTYLIKADINGNSIWSKVFGGINYDYGFSTDQITDGGYIVIGYTQNGVGAGDVNLIRQMHPETLYGQELLAE
jgi:regulation of enolase protein 1 (concanavalin A-like superfamily)